MSQTVKSKLQCVYTRARSMQRGLHLHTCPYLGIFLWFLSDNMCILTTELRSGHMVEESCCLADLERCGGGEITQTDGIQSREVLSLAIWFKCCWEMNQGVEGSEKAPEQLSAFCFSIRVYPKKQKSHICGKAEFTFVFMSVQFRVHRGRPAPRGAGQAGEDGLLRAVHDGGGTDAGVVPTQESMMGETDASKRLLKPF